MKHWEIYGSDIVLERDNRIIRIEKSKDGKYKVMEACDYCFMESYTRDEMIELLEEAIEWVKAIL